MATINVTPGGVVDYTATVSGSQPITFALSGAPAWLTINQQSGRLQGTVPQNQPAGTINFEILAQNCFQNGQPGNIVRKPMEVVVGSSCQPVSIFDSQTASCVPLDLVSTTYTNTIAKGQVRTDFTIRAEGDESPGQPIVLWTNSAGATLSRVPGTARDYKLVISSGPLADGTYDYVVFGANCRAAADSPVATTQRRFTVIVGTGVGGPPATGGGGGSCAATINAPGSHPIDQPLNYQMSLTTGGSCGGWQTWLLYPNEAGSPGGTGSVPGQIDSVGISPGSYTKDVSNMAPGNYLLWAKCNDAGSCQDTWVTKPITLTAAGTQPGTGNPGTPCTPPKLVPLAPATFSMRPGTQISFEVWLTEDSPVEGVSLTARDGAGVPISGAYLRTTIAWITGRRYNMTVFMPTRDMPPQSQLFIEARNPCGLATFQLNVNRDDSAPPVVPNCVKTVLSNPPSSQITEPMQTVSVAIPYTGSLPVSFTSYSHPNVWFASWTGNTIKAEGEFAYGDHDVVITIVSCDGSRQTVIWSIRKA